MRKKILIIEDEQILREMYIQKLSQANFNVIAGENVKEGLILAKKEKPDLILLDILLPKENGISFLEKLKKDPEISNLKVIAFSNYDDPQTRKKAEQFAIDGYWIKTDYTPKEIVKKIKEYFKKAS